VTEENLHHGDTEARRFRGRRFAPDLDRCHPNLRKKRRKPGTPVVRLAVSPLAHDDNLRSAEFTALGFKHGPRIAHMGADLAESVEWK